MFVYYVCVGMYVCAVGFGVEGKGVGWGGETLMEKYRLSVHLGEF